QTRARARTEGSPLFINFHLRRSSVPSGCDFVSLPLPGVETPGSFRQSLRDTYAEVWGMRERGPQAKWATPWDRRIAVKAENYPHANGTVAPSSAMPRGSRADKCVRRYTSLGTEAQGCNPSLSCEHKAVSTGMGAAHSMGLLCQRCQFVAREFFVYFC